MESEKTSRVSWLLTTAIPRDQRLPLSSPSLTFG